jgi:hypothetical protein
MLPTTDVGQPTLCGFVPQVALQGISVPRWEHPVLQGAITLPQYAPGGFNGCGIGHTAGGIYGPAVG